MFQSSRRSLLVAFTATLIAACAATPPTPTADVVLQDGRIYTLDPAQPWAEAVAFRDGVIAFVGSSVDVAKFEGEQTQVIDLAGAMAMPGLIDAHIHPIRGARKELYECRFPFSATPEEIQATVARCVSERSNDEWVIGGQWDSGFFERFEIESPRALLDEVSGDVPVLLNDDSLHNTWANSAALRAAGITADSEDPEGGTILREASGAPNGVLLETAAKIMLESAPPFTLEQNQRAAREFARIVNAYGITGVKAAATRDDEIAGLAAAGRAGELSVRVAISIRGSHEMRRDPLDYERIERLRRDNAAPNVDLNFVKFFLDGVPTPARTAGMLDPYVADAKHGDSYRGGELLLTVDPLAQDLIELEKRGFTVKMHAAGDRSLREALDAIEVARRANGNLALRHEIAHAGYVHPDDIPRFAALNASPDFSPYLWHPSPIIDAVILAVGNERGPRYWPTRDLIDAGAQIIVGSDWPAAVEEADPWIGMEALVTRADPRGQASGKLWPEQAITLEEALVLFTRNGAAALRRETEIGSLEVGKSADLIVLNHNLFEIDPSAISDTRVTQTWFKGERVYGAAQPADAH